MAVTYRKKPVVVEAMLWEGSAEEATPIIDWLLANGATARYHEYEPPKMHSTACRCDGRGIVPGDQFVSRHVEMCPETEPKGPGLEEYIAIDTLEGTMSASAGDFIVKGTRGEFYPCKPGPFEDTFELVEEEPNYDYDWAVDLQGAVVADMD